MESGFIFLISGYPSMLCWSTEVPSFWSGQPKYSVRIMGRGLFGYRDKKYWSRNGCRCQKCGLITFEYSLEEKPP